MDSASDGEPYEFVLYEEVDDGAIVRVILNRPKYRNAQHRPLLVELDHALMRAEADDRVRVVILSGVGTMFSSGHDMGSPEHYAERDPGLTGGGGWLNRWPHLAGNCGRLTRP